MAAVRRSFDVGTEGARVMLLFMTVQSLAPFAKFQPFASRAPLRLTRCRRSRLRTLTHDVRNAFSYGAQLHEFFAFIHLDT